MSWLDIFRKKQEKIPEVNQYEALFDTELSKKTPIKDLSFVVLDTETTGLDVKNDHVLAFGGIKIINERIKVDTSMESLLFSTKQNVSSIKIHEIIQSNDAMPIDDFVKLLLPYLSTHIMVAHHAGFDQAMLEKLVKPYGLRKILNPVVDTGDLAIRIEHGMPYDPNRINLKDYSLDALCERYKIPIHDRHTAAGDAFLTAQLLLKLLKEADKKGIKTYGDLMRY
ncbi:3'-5' exonuclease [Echinicola salinicaeni]|uniref:3'-5' exonuclease n=1 Tax=Echinicola salinicaeni TaxID=2762757 RepID=UPI0016496644|nr:3'-5' exonuclease [Echinicola salinicaeni]